MYNPFEVSLWTYLLTIVFFVGFMWLMILYIRRPSRDIEEVKLITEDMLEQIDKSIEIHMEKITEEKNEIKAYHADIKRYYDEIKKNDN